MVEQQPSQNLSPQLCAVLGSLNVSLESELNRYRRNRRLDGLADEDLFADLDEAIFGSDLADDPFESSLVPIPAAMPITTPPSVPPNKRLLAEEHSSQSFLDADRLQIAQPGSGAEYRAEYQAEYSAEGSDVAHEQRSGRGALVQKSLLPEEGLAISDVESSSFGPVTSGSIVKVDRSEQAMPAQLGGVQAGVAVLSGSEPAIAPAGYLESSEKLIESLEDVPPLPDPVQFNRKPKKKTVSLLAGASLGLVGLVAGLGASYLMANPAITQKIVSRFQRPETQVATNQPAKSFDPPGPDLSANEFIDLELDNLSSLKMPSTGVNTDLATGDISSPSANTALPPIDQSSLQPVVPVTPPSISGVVSPGEGAAIAPNANAASAPAIETQAVVVPTGITYYVTAPFNTNQDLLSIRETVSEAFVRQFVSGNKIQIAAFDNPETAQQFVDELAVQQITAQIYGPTAE